MTQGTYGYILVLFRITVVIQEFLKITCSSNTLS